MVKGHRRLVPGATSRSAPGKVQGRDRVGIEGSCGYRARGVSIRGNFVLSRNLGMEVPHCHWRSNIGPWLLITVIKGQIVIPCALHCHKRTGSPI